ncbi:MAG: SDR family NAD(P)-dependent oxidoreductase, partial [Myxococcaceae bacterium]|nr:SDR family NAD(P)-dependent oxidoreductase [Myxococcaceae bacterium]
EALAEALAARGAHVVVTARTKERLEALRARIEAAGGRATVVPVDLAAPGAAQRLFDEVQRLELPVDALVNNAGFGFFGPFEAEAPAHLGEMLQVNVVALAELTRLFVPSLLVRRGAVLNVASTVAFQPSPYLAAYGATKAFVLSLSEALWAEYRSAGLHVAAVCPGPVETPFLDAAGAGVRSTAIFRTTLSVDEVVRACLSALDSTAPTHVVGLRNWLMAQSARFSPRALTARVGAVLLAPPKSSSPLTPKALP